MAASIADRLTGRAMVERTRKSGIRAALNPQEMIAVAGLFVIGFALLFSNAVSGEESALLGSRYFWGGIALALAIPQALGLTLARLGFAEVPMAHYFRITMLLCSMFVLIVAAFAFVDIGLGWIGGGSSFVFSLSAAAASRHVHLNNGRSRKMPHLDPEVSETLMRNGFRSGTLLRD